MLAKNNMQQQNRRNQLSLNQSMKPNKSNDNNKKESTNNTNQKTENLKKDSQMERKLSSDKKQFSTDAKRSSSTSSTDSRKQDDSKINKNNDNDNKKNQNGHNGNSNKSNKQQTIIEAVAKTKPESVAASNGNSAANKKESQKPVTEKKKEAPVVVEVVAKVDNNKEVVVEKTKEAKNEENKRQTSEKAVEDKKPAEEKSTKEKKETVDLTVENKKTDEKANEVEIVEKPAAVKEPNLIEQAEIIVEEKTTTKSEEPTTLQKTPIKETRAEEPPKEDNAMLDNELEDVEMMESLKYIEDQPPACSVFAVSTPAKSCSPKEALNLFDVTSKRSPKSEVKQPKETLTHTPDRKSCPRTFSSISGRRSIRPIGDYTFSGNLQIRESYRKINTELDFTTSSLNVTVGSEVPNNESFSFFSRSRKRDRSSPSHQSAMEVQGDLSPKSPKRARVENIGGGGGAMHGFFNAMASPITMLRARLARASVQSTPKKLIVDPIEQEIVENVSAIAVEAIDMEEEELTATEEQVLNPDSTVADVVEQPQPEEPAAKCSQQNPDDLPVAVEADDDIKIKETITAATDSQAKKRCSIM